jgi:hypothetical protein
MPFLLFLLPACWTLLLLDIWWSRLLEWGCLLLLHGEKLLVVPLLV